MNQLEQFMKEHEGDHYNGLPSVLYKVSTGSLKLDLALDGGLGPGIHRFGGSSEGGKALPVDEPVLTPSGWVKIGDIKVGDSVIGVDGKPTKVIGVFPQGVKDIFIVKTEDGGAARCCDDHLWTTQTGLERRDSEKNKANIVFESVKTTKQIRSSMLRANGEKNHSIRLCSPVEFDKPKKHFVSLYQIGLSLMGYESLTSAKKIDSLMKEPDVSLDEYIYSSSVEDRRELLMGMFGSHNMKSEFVLKAPVKKFGRKIQELVWSLGGRATITKTRGKCFSHKHRTETHLPQYYEVAVSFEGQRRVLTSIDSCGSAECVCIKVENQDGLFITSDYLVTHNTSSALEIASNAVKTVPNSKVLYIKAEGRLSDKVKKRSGLKFVEHPQDWEVGTAFCFKSNIYDTAAQLIYSLITENPNDYKYIIIIDSLDGFILKADLAKRFDDGDHVKIAGPNVLTKRLMKQVSLPISEYGHMMIVIAQVIAKIENKYEKKDQLSVGGAGGNAAIHFANYILDFLPRFKKHLITSDGKSAVLDFDETNIAGHWCQIKIDKSENEASSLHVEYPIKYARSSEDGEGRIWTEMEIKSILEMFKLIVSKGAWIYISETAVEDMRAAMPNEEIPEKLNGEKKFLEFVSQPNILAFWKNKIREMLVGGDLL